MRTILFVLLLMPMLLGATDTNSQVQFINNNLNGAKEKARQEGKLYVVNFVTTYCYLCKMMDETTFSDRRVTDYVEQNYVPVKVNIEDFDGIEWKQKYDIRLVPTIIIFDSNGEPVGRYEESMGSARMLEVLERHNFSQNKTVENTTSSAYPTTTESTTYTPPPVYTSPPTYTATGRHSTSPPLVNTAPEAETATGLFEFTVKRAPTSGYGVQTGVFAEYGNVLREVERLDKLFGTQILVNINQLNGRTVYKIIVGYFPTRQGAEAFQYRMAVQGTTGFVADLSSLQ